MIKNIAKSTAEVIGRVDRVVTFIETNCHVHEYTVISTQDLSDITTIIKEELNASYMNADIGMSAVFNKSLNRLAKLAIQYLSSIVDTPTHTSKCRDKMNSLIKDFIGSIARYFHMGINKFLVYMLMK